MHIDGIHDALITITGGKNFIQVGRIHDTGDLGNIDTRNDLLLLRIKDNNIPIKWPIARCIKVHVFVQRQQVGTRPAMRNEQAMRGYIKRLKVECIEIYRYARSQQGLLGSAWNQPFFLGRSRQAIGQWDILD